MVSLNLWRASFAFQFEEAVHELVNRVNLDHQEPFIEDFIVLGVDKPQALSEIGGSLEEVVVFQESDASLTHGFEVIHKNGGGFFSFLPVLLRKCLDAFLYLFDLGLILDLWQIECFYFF